MPIYLKHCSQICLICVSEHFSFAEIIHPPHRCGISKCWLDSMVIAQVCLRLVTIKGHSKIYSFITQHNATDCRKLWGSVQLACWLEECPPQLLPWIECSFLYHKPSPNMFQRIWQYIQRPDNRRPRVFSFFCLLSILPNCCGNFFHTNIITE